MNIYIVKSEVYSFYGVFNDFRELIEELEYYFMFNPDIYDTLRDIKIKINGTTLVYYGGEPLFKIEHYNTRTINMLHNK